MNVTEEQYAWIGRWYMLSFRLRLDPDSVKLKPGQSLLGRQFRLVEVTND